MSAAAVSGAAKTAATTTAQSTKKNTVYLFRHIQTSQVLVSLKSSVEVWQQQQLRISNCIASSDITFPSSASPFFLDAFFFHSFDRLTEQ